MGKTMPFITLIAIAMCFAAVAIVLIQHEQYFTGVVVMVLFTMSGAKARAGDEPPEEES